MLIFKCLFTLKMNCKRVNWSQVVVTHIFNPSIGEAAAGISLWVGGQAVLQSELQDRQSYAEKPHLKKAKKKKTPPPPTKRVKKKVKNQLDFTNGLVCTFWSWSLWQPSWSQTFGSLPMSASQIHKSQMCVPLGFVMFIQFKA